MATQIVLQDAVNEGDMDELTASITLHKDTGALTVSFSGALVDGRHFVEDDTYLVEDRDMRMGIGLAMTAIRLDQIQKNGGKTTATLYEPHEVTQ